MPGIGLINVDAGTILGGIGQLAKDIRSAITGKEILDPNKQAEILLKVQELENAANQGAIDIAKIEASSTSIFIAGARPFVMWMCGGAFGWNYFLGPMFVWLSGIFGRPTPMAVLDLSVMMPVLLAMLGFGGYRTFEKLKDAEGNR